MTEAKTWNCEICKVTLDSERALRAHVDAHITCTACKFQGSRTVVKAHFDSVHGRFTGNGFKSVTIAIPGCPVQRFRICVGNHPDDVQKWIAERRQRFPRRQQEQQQQQQDHPQQRDRELQQVCLQKNEPSGIALLAGYGSSSSDDDDPSPLSQTEKTSCPRDEKHDSSHRIDHERQSKVGSEDLLSQRLEHQKSHLNNSTHQPARNLNDRASKAGRNVSKFPRNHRVKVDTSSSLLKKLLEQEVRRESTLTLQLFRYIVDSNFLEGTNADSEPPLSR